MRALPRLRPLILLELMDARILDSIVPNSIARSKVERRTFVGDEISDSKDFSAITSRSPFDRVSSGLPR